MTSTSRVVGAIAVLALIAACPHRPHRTLAEVPPAPISGSAGVDDPALAAVFDAHWAWLIDSAPEWGDWLGFGPHDRLSDPSIAAADAVAEATREWLARLDAIDRSALLVRDQDLYDQLHDKLTAARDSEVCHFERWALSTRVNPLANFLAVANLQPVSHSDDVSALVRRIEAMPGVLAAQQAALRDGIERGLVIDAVTLSKVLDQLHAQRDKPVRDWAIVTRVPKASRDRVAAAVSETLLPTLDAWDTFLRDELMPVARPDVHPGLAGLSGIDGCYEARIFAETGLRESAEALHQLGLDELARIHAELRVVGERALGTSDLAVQFERLRTDPSLRFRSAREIVAYANDAVDRARAALPEAFAVLPSIPIVVDTVPAHEAPYTYVAYYRPPSGDGTRPGAYVVNTYAPTTRPRFEAAALAFHEGIPGHHLQLARAYAMGDEPAILKYDGSNALVEGWALYAERLADELHLYRGDLETIGRLSFEAWRAARLVVDTGLHAKGWSREQAIAFMMHNTGLAANNIENEVDRYISWPGQALAYKVGQIEILRLRADALERLGARFDLRAFHELVLGSGSVTLPVLRGRYERWLDTELRK